MPLRSIALNWFVGFGLVAEGDQSSTTSQGTGERTQPYSLSRPCGVHIHCLGLLLGWVASTVKDAVNI